MELITGKTGTQHVFAADDALIYKMMCGSGDYVLPIGNQLDARMNGVSQVIISDGALIMQGRLARTRASSGEDTLQIDNGVSGQKRADLIVAQYSKYEAEVEREVEGETVTVTEMREKVELKVIKGSNSPNEYVTPTVTTRDIDTIANTTDVHQVALWEVRLDGINFNSLIDHRVYLNPVIDTVQNNLSTIQENLLTMAYEMASSIGSRFSGIYRGTWEYLSASSISTTFQVALPAGYEHQAGDIPMVYLNGMLVPEEEITSLAYNSNQVTVEFPDEIAMKETDVLEVVMYR